MLYLNSLSKILVCGADGIIFILDVYLVCLSVCFVRFFCFYLVEGVVGFLGGLYFIMNNLMHFIDWNIVTLNCRWVVMTFIFIWMSLWFI